MLNEEEIKKWLKDTGKNRQWLAEKTLSKKRTVDGWLSDGNPIPPAKLAVIERLMNGEDEIQFELPENFETLLRQKAKAAHKSIEDLVNEILEMTVQEQKRKQQASGTYQEAVEKLHPALDNDDEPEEVNNVILRPVKLPEIMVVGNVAAGEITWSDLDEPYPVFDKGITALHVEGTSMEPEIKNGQVVLVRPVPKNADLEKYVDEIVVYDGGDSLPGITLKRLVADDEGHFFLVPVNPAFRRRIPITGQIKACMVGKIDLTK
jgi:SOS-response transcriptional repressor LexA